MFHSYAKSPNQSYQCISINDSSCFNFRFWNHLSRWIWWSFSVKCEDLPTHHHCAKHNIYKYKCCKSWDFCRQKIRSSCSWFSKSKWKIFTSQFNIEMGPDPTRAYFCPTVSKRPTAFDFGTLWPNSKIIFDPKWKKLKNLGFLGEIFQTQTKEG